MKKVVIYGDLWILSNIFQKFSTWSQKTFGLTNFWWTRFFATIAFVAFTIQFYLVFDVTAYAWIIFSRILIWLLLLAFVLGINDTCLELDKKYANGYSYVNERVKALFLHRIMWSIAHVWNFSLDLMRTLTTGNLHEAWLFDITLGLIPVCLYFISCTPLPPGQSKVSKWIKGVKNKMQQVFSPEPSLAPSRC
ncbi:MAG: hypothetical protein ACKUBY_04245 [Candidatus Moraniibacteriota bacterium]|jgi:hypothetical protein